MKIDTRTKYRIIVSSVFGYNVQMKKWYWFDWGNLSTGHSTINVAEKWLEEYRLGAIRIYVDGE